MLYICAAYRNFYNQQQVNGGGFICNGTFYRDGFDSDVIDILETARLTCTRLRIYLGNSDAGEDLQELHVLSGYVECWSVECWSGVKNVPLLVSTKRSRGGGEIMPPIVKIETSKGKIPLYIHNHNTNQ